MIEFREVSYSIGGRVILDRATFSIPEGARAGLIGPNGSGKTTLIRLLVGMIAPDAGEISVQKGKQVGYLAQTPEFAAGDLVFRYVAEDQPVLRDLTERIRALEARMEAEHDPVHLDRLVEQHRSLDRELAACGGFEVEGRAEAILAGLGIPRALFGREIRTLSGGEKNRVALARLLATSPDVLVLDEPTNYLDIEMVEWLEEYLSGLDRTVLASSHDRYFLNRCARLCMEIRGGKVHQYRGNYDAYALQREEEVALELKRFQKIEGEIARELEFIRRNFYGQRARQAKSREKRVARLAGETAPLPETGPGPPRIRFDSTLRGGDDVLSLEEVACGYGDRALIAGVNVILGRGERVAVLGRNGCGKTTLLKTMAGELAPLAGAVDPGVRTMPMRYDQECATADSPRSVFDEIHDLVPRWDDLEVRDLLAAFLFRGDRIRIPIRDLSGGEKAKVALIRLILSRANLLLLDEPTNHLDIHSRAALEEALLEFPETIVFVSHDRYFIERVATRVLSVDEGRIREMIGGYPEYREALRLARVRDAAERRARREERAPRSARAKPRRRLDEEKLLAEINRKESEVRALQEEASRVEVCRSAEASRRVRGQIQALEAEIAALYARWEEGAKD
jgi:ATP-binding cassette, subfamily F, member 3